MLKSNFGFVIGESFDIDLRSIFDTFCDGRLNSSFYHEHNGFNPFHVTINFDMAFSIFQIGNFKAKWFLWLVNYDQGTVLPQGTYTWLISKLSVNGNPLAFVLVLTLI